MASSAVAGVAYAIDLRAFNQCFPDTLRESAYLKCFTRLVKGITANVAVFNQDEPEPISKIEYTFDSRPEVEFSAARVYSTYLNDPLWTYGSLMESKVSFESRANPRIQMADMIAREAMKDLDRVVGPKTFAERRSKIELAKNGHFRFFNLGREDFEHERAQIAEMEKDGISEAAYHEWLTHTGAQDTWDNRVRFLEYLEARRR